MEMSICEFIVEVTIYEFTTKLALFRCYKINFSELL